MRLLARGRQWGLHASGLRFADRVAVVRFCLRYKMMFYADVLLREELSLMNDRCLEQTTGRVGKNGVEQTDGRAADHTETLIQCKEQSGSNKVCFLRSRPLRAKKYIRVRLPRETVAARAHAQ